VKKKTEVAVLEPRMVQRGDLDKAVQEMLAHQKSLNSDINLCIDKITDPGLMRHLTRKSVECEHKIKGLEAGFIPVDGIWFARLESKSKWRSKDIEKEMKTISELPHTERLRILLSLVE